MFALVFGQLHAPLKLYFKTFIATINLKLQFGYSYNKQNAFYCHNC